MAVIFRFRSANSPLGGAGQRLLSQTAGGANTDIVTETVRDSTSIQATATLGGQNLTWFTEPITAAITISASVVVRITGREDNTATNAGAGILIERCNNAGTVLSTIVANSTLPATITEWTTANTTKTRTFTPTSTAMAVGERIKATIFVRNVGTMEDGSVTHVINSPAATGTLTEIQFTENIRTDEVIDTQQPAVYGSNGYIG